MMEELVNMIATDASAADISDQIKDMLFAKSAKRIDELRPHAAEDLFGSQEVEVDDTDTVDTVEDQPQEEPTDV
tara:strand:- start:2426 stop:2647 length:222 start_codon:yes stop_codon:yes gene_type:complete